MAQFYGGRIYRAARWVNAHRFNRRTAHRYSQEEQFYRLTSLETQRQAALKNQAELAALAQQAQKVFEAHQTWQRQPAGPGRDDAEIDYLVAAQNYQKSRAEQAVALAETGGAPVYVRAMVKDRAHNNREMLDYAALESISQRDLEIRIKHEQQQYRVFSEAAGTVANKLEDAIEDAVVNSRGRVSFESRDEIAKAVNEYREKALESSQAVGYLRNPVRGRKKRTSTFRRDQDGNKLDIAPTTRYTRRWRHWREMASFARRTKLANKIEDLELAPQKRAEQRREALRDRWEAYSLDGGYQPLSPAEIMAEPDENFRNEMLARVVRATGDRSALAAITDGSVAAWLDAELLNGNIPDTVVARLQRERDDIATEIEDPLAGVGLRPDARAAKATLEDLQTVYNHLNDLGSAISELEKAQQEVSAEFNEGRPRLETDLTAEEQQQIQAAQKRVENAGIEVTSSINDPDKDTAAAAAELQAAQADLEQLRGPNGLNVTDDPSQAAVPFNAIDPNQLTIAQQERLDQAEQAVQDEADNLANLSTDQLHLTTWGRPDIRNSLIKNADGKYELDTPTMIVLQNEVDVLRGPDDAPQIGILGQAQQLSSDADAQLQAAESRLETANQRVTQTQEKAAKLRKDATTKEHKAEKSFTSALNKALRTRGKLQRANRRADRRYEDAAEKAYSGLDIPEVPVGDAASPEVADFYNNRKPSKLEQLRGKLAPTAATPKYKTSRPSTRSRPAA